MVYPDVLIKIDFRPTDEELRVTTPAVPPKIMSFAANAVVLPVVREASPFELVDQVAPVLVRFPVPPTPLPAPAVVSQYQVTAWEDEKKKTKFKVKNAHNFFMV